MDAKNSKPFLEGLLYFAEGDVGYGYIIHFSHLIFILQVPENIRSECK